jgi:hypothetical protein
VFPKIAQSALQVYVFPRGDSAAYLKECRGASLNVLIGPALEGTIQIATLKASHRNSREGHPNLSPIAFVKLSL